MRTVQFESADDPGKPVEVPADPEAVVTPGDRPGTARVTAGDGPGVQVVGNYRDVHVKIQAAAAAAHERGDDWRPPAGGQSP